MAFFNHVNCISYTHRDELMFPGTYLKITDLDKRNCYWMLLIILDRLSWFICLINLRLLIGLILLVISHFVEIVCLYKRAKIGRDHTCLSGLNINNENQSFVLYTKKVSYYNAMIMILLCVEHYTKRWNIHKKKMSKNTVSSKQK